MVVNSPDDELVNIYLEHLLLLTLFYHVERGLQYRGEITTFVHLNKELSDLELSETEWTSVQLVASWLEQFHKATAEMSTTKKPMLSHTHAIFHGLQAALHEALARLPENTDLEIRDGLINAHTKLGTYYYQFDQSPFYLWASCGLKFSSFQISYYMLTSATVLDPRISYDGLVEDFADELQLLQDLNHAKQKLYNYYNSHYAHLDVPETLSQQTNATASTSNHGSAHSLSFTARYQCRGQVLHQLDEYFKLSREPDFDNCDPLDWWRTY